MSDDTTAANTPADSTLASSSHIRGSMLLLCGRLFSLAVNLVTQVAVVRYLSKADFGTFALAITVVEIASMLTALGMARAVSRFVPIYHERGEYPKLFGAILLALGLSLGLGVAAIALVFGTQGLIFGSWEPSTSGTTVLLVMILMTPVGSLDSVLLATFTAFAQSRLIFVRRYLVGPALKLGAAVLVIYFRGDVIALAIAHVVAGVLGLALYGAMLVHVMRSQRLLERFQFNSLRFPSREILGFGLPLLGADVAIAIRTFLIVALLQVLHSVSSVAEFRAVLPIARLNGVALLTFSVMFIPIAARIYARGDRDSLSEMYWRSAAWTTVVTFPVFAFCMVCPSAITELFFGQRYATAGSLLAVLAIGYFFQASLGMNARTLEVLGKLKQVVAIDCLLTVIAIGLFFLLIPPLGALGGAIAASATMVMRGTLNQIALVRHSHIRVFERRYAGVFGTVAISSLFLVAVHWLLDPPLAAGLCLASVLSLAVTTLSLPSLQLGKTFPELRRYLPANRLGGSL